MSDAHCRQTFDGYRCRKPVGHKGHHYADTTNGCGVGWGNLREDGYPNDAPTEDPRRAVRDAWLTALAHHIARDGSPMDDMGWETTHE